MMQSKSIDVIHTHTLDLPSGNKIKDSEINNFSLAEQRIVITKDNGFVNSLLSGNSWDGEKDK
jgi:predicted nuclease of predicted toxin-antitoxin system